MPRTTGQETKAAIKATALEEFASRGTDVPLDEIARHLGITRSAILHHFGSKASLSQEIVVDFQAALERLLDPYRDATPPLPRRQRDQLLSQVVDVYCDHRKVVMMILRDVPASWPHIIEWILRFMELLIGKTPSPEDVIVVDAVLGVIVRPLIDPAVDTDPPRHRALLTAMATQMAGRLDPR